MNLFRFVDMQQMKCSRNSFSVVWILWWAIHVHLLWF